jgi:septal ring factor EnvC (AmiA/AmiB activator)
MRVVALWLLSLSSVAIAKEEPKEENPVGKVVTLLEELKAGIEADGVEEQEVFDKYACWCEETTDKKSKAIVDAQQEMKRTGTMILELKGLVAVRDGEISTLKKELGQNEAGQKSATTIRSKQNVEFQAEKAEMESTIGSLEKGIMVLTGAGTKGASLIERKGVLAQTAQHVKKALDNLPAPDSLSPKQLKAVSAFLADPAEYYDQKAEKAAAYNPASTTIMGILKDMYDQFSANLEKQTMDEADSQQSFEEIIAVKEKEAATLTATIQTKTAEKAEAEQMLADASQELDDVSKQMKADALFFSETKAACGMKADEWAERSRARTEELAGIAKAIEILGSDDAKEKFSKAIKPGMEKTFLQVNQEVHAVKKPQQKAYEALTSRAKKVKSLRLASLAAKIQQTSLGHFDTVVEEVDRMIGVLKKEEGDDINHRDWCKEETFKNEQEVARYEYKIDKSEAKIKKLQSALEELEDLLAKTVSEIQSTQEEITQMENDRLAAHQAFEDAQKADKEAIKLLGEAIESMKTFYRNNPPAALIEKKAWTSVFGPDDEPAPDAEFSDKNKSKGEAKGVVGIMEMLKEDLEAEVKNGVKNEKEAQAEFEEAKGTALRVVKTLNDKKTNIKQEIAQTNTEIDETTTIKEDFEVELTNEKAYLTEIKPDCDWILENFADRRFKRGEEMEGLVEAKSMLLSSKPMDLIQKEATTSFLKRH